MISLAIFVIRWLQDAPAQTFNYFLAGQLVIFGVISIYLASLFIRRRNLEQDLAALEQMQGKPD